MGFKLTWSIYFYMEMLSRDAQIRLKHFIEWKQNDDSPANQMKSITICAFNYRFSPSFSNAAIAKQRRNRPIQLNEEG